MVLICSQLNINERVNFHKGCIVYKCRNGLVPQYLAEIFSNISDKHEHHTRTKTRQNLNLVKPNAPFTPGGDCRTTGHDSTNRHWSLVVAPSPRLVANVRCTVSRLHGNEKIIFISATKWTVALLRHNWDTVLLESHD